MTEIVKDHKEMSMRRQRPIILGIVGDSASGKTTIADGLVKLLGPERVTQVCTDDYHRYDRHERAEHNITALHPDCNYLDILELHLERLHFGQPILKPVYDHTHGTLGRPEYVKPREFVIVEGLLGFYSAVMRQFYDIKVYLDPDDRMRRLWKVRRDTAKRGYTQEQVLAQLENREYDSRSFIRPQREHADVVVHFYPPHGTELSGVDEMNQVQSHLNGRLILRPTIPHPDLSYLWTNTRDEDAGIRLELGRDGGRPVDILEIDGNVSPGHAVELEQAIWQHIPDLSPLRADQFGHFYDDQQHVRHSDPLALTQLLLTYHLLRQCSDTSELPFARPVAAFSRLASVPVSEQERER
jgi:phosphoribulokinase